MATTKKKVPSTGESEPEGAVPGVTGPDGPDEDEVAAALENAAQLHEEALAFKDAAKEAVIQADPAT